MKKLLILLLTTIFLFSAFSAKKNKVKSDFVTRYDEIKDVTYITHKDMKLGYMPNLRSTLLYENENVRLYIANTHLHLAFNCSYRNWAFYEHSVFLSSGGRLQLPTGVRSSVAKPNFVQEQYDYVLEPPEIDELEKILSNSDPAAALFGNGKQTPKLKIPANVAAAMLATIAKYKELLDN